MVKKLGPKTLMKDIIKHTLQDNDSPHTMKSFGDIFKGRCVVGNMTGTCNHPHCKFEHEKEMLEHSATAVAEIIKAALKGAKKARGG